MAKEKNYDAMASQIGDLGGDLAGALAAGTESQAGLGKLKHKSSYGQKEDLTPEEEAAKNAFLQRQRRKAEEREEREEFIADNGAEVAEGWIPLSRKEFGIRSQFYPEDWQFYIRPATVQAIKNWIGIDEKNALQLMKVFDEVIKLCVRIKSSTGSVSWSHVNTWDRFWLIMKVREATFASNKKAITFEDTCGECDEEMTFELRSDTLHYEFPDADIVNKHYIPEELIWSVDPTEYGVEDEPITLYVPTLAKQQAIVDWMQREYQRKKKLDETFCSTFLPWLLNKASKDEVQFDRQVQKIYKEYKNWSVPFHTLMADIIRNITINPKETLKQVCPHCGEEVISNVQFPDGVKVLFATETGVQKFGSR